MKSHRTPRRLAAALLAGVTALSLAACGVQGGGAAKTETDFPTKPIEFTLPSSAGGSTDLIGRAVAKALEKPLGQPIPVVNKAGANGAVGGKEVLGSRADGYKMVMLFKSLMAITPLAVDDANPIVFDQMKVVGGLTVEDYVLVVNTAKHPDGDLAALLGQEGLAYGTAGTGTGGQLSQALLLAKNGVKYKDVPFQGGAPAVTALLGEQVDAITVQIAEAMPHIKSGAFRPIATFGEKRSEFLPEVPTAKESGHDIVVDQKRFIAYPKDTDAAIVTKVANSLTEAFKDPEYDAFLKSNFISRWEVPGSEVVSDISQAKDTFARVVQENGISLKG
ncbi:MAG: tripartite tricarboxylate transporter substrate binding protein [Propioniciclava sp.]|uniref:Bug family tripartite tricarboxylate transporter substrate binding protein n=1 Tax=Propioniciclava sp. TaxID=2038686 RepID=UPI0039E541E5